MSLSIRVVAVAAAAVSAFAVGAIVAFAHGGDATAIHACIGKETKSLRVLAAPGIGSPSDECKAGELAVDWNQTGPQGPQGVQGPQGPAGPAGPGGSLAHAFVRANGDVVEERSDGITDAMVTPTPGEEGMYCFALPFDFDVAVATPIFVFVIDDDGNFTTKLEHSANVFYRGAGTIDVPQCDGENLLVEITDLDGDGLAIPFTVVIF
jgi:hypothetical protein